MAIKITKTRVALFGTLTAFVFMGFLGYRLFHVKVGISVDAYPGLPTSAHEISYRDSLTMTVIKFKIDQQGFIDWAKQRGFTNKGYQRSDGSYNLDMGRTIQVYIDKEHTEVMEFPVEFWYLNREMDGGGYSVGYDPNTRWAVYSRSAN